MYFLTSWIPRIAVDAGYPLATAIRGSSAFNIGALLGLLLLGLCASRIDLAKLIVGFFVGAAVALGVVAVWHRPVTIFYGGMVLTGVLVQGGFGGLYAIAGQLYPPEAKSTGVGWSIGIGRLGAVAGPAVGGLILSSGMGLAASFTVFAIPMLVAAALTWLISRTDPARGLR
ncbi:MAG: MFS transporter [Proteobacteria bacterium]|nr:MAG: MFS transporter [Pseudomonadota bacterium]